MITNLTLLEKAALLSGRNVWETRSLPRHGVRSLFLSDGPHGVRKQLGSSDHLGLHESEKATCFPTAATIANSWDVDLADRIGRALGAEARSLGVDVLLGPGLNIKRSPLCGRNFEYFSEDPYLSGKLAAAYVRGIQKQGVAATPKHFAVNNQELRRMTTDSVLDERTLREIYLAAFEIVVRESAPRALMSSYNLVNGVYANEDPFLLSTVLRGEWGFTGAVITDWGGGNDAVAGARNGSTLEMPSPGFDSAHRLVEAVRSGALAESVLDERVREMLALSVETLGAAPAEVDVSSHHDLARSAAASSIVLLKNEDRVLPLRKGTRVAVIGDFAENPRYQGSGSSVVNPTRMTTTLESLPYSGLELVAFERGYERDGRASASLLEAAVRAAAPADVVLVYLGLDEISESEGLDRVHMRMPANQIELLTRLHEVNPRIVVVLSAGSAVEIPWLEKCSALVHGYLGGQAGAAAMLDVLTGVVTPSGKLAETYPLRSEDTAVHAYYPGTERTAEYREGLFVGYRYFVTAGVPVRFPFGFGLSYTEFEYSGLTADESGVRFTLTNTGLVAGAEIAQLYVGRTTNGIPRPTRELKGFVKIALAPGESRAVTIPMDETTFRHYDVGRRSWEVETGEYLVSVGASVADIRLSASLAVGGSIDPVEPAAALAPYASGRVAAVTDEEFAALLGRPVPDARWSTRDLAPNDPLCRMSAARSPLARLAVRLLERRMKQAEALHRPDLNLLFLYNMPFRSIAKMTNGTVSTDMVDALLQIVNGEHIRGIGALVKRFVLNRRLTVQLRRELGRGA
ncbi:glycoside hydrolase family 3 C-terminal domain-containing protein [Rathayibacter sp. VKM Ac-2835]|uniref:glycoside hydrolase family 3 C-terminal domain-containing protein n=1 Tax=Rathayibacter sp. VKM Ac-2835 TaxID=2739043 RepID=UPI001564B98F|nr:glycoside hydrolase family 3 C-terminal domain-containing protein [Rathayibacter sp. VKM Ac-2835]NRG41085.1 glycoside hydrolase family 3 C-terminal domain-containing protein [Rathayibacter sp. VKM Ac-2835]